MNILINRILTDNYFQEIALPLGMKNAELHLFKPITSMNRQEYFLVAKLHDESDASANKFLDSYAQEWFDIINSSDLVEQEFAKNCTLILCHKEDDLDKSTLLLIEEEQFNFKKNVITYSEKELLDLRSYIDKKNLTELSEIVINNIINEGDGEMFLNFKANNQIQQNYYSLLLKIILKLPFIHYLPKDKNLTNLSNQIELSLSPRLLLIYKTLTDSDELWSDDEIDKKLENIWGTNL